MWGFNLQNKIQFHSEAAFENAVCIMAVILLQS